MGVRRTPSVGACRSGLPIDPLGGPYGRRAGAHGRPELGGCRAASCLCSKGAVAQSPRRPGHRAPAVAPIGLSYEWTAPRSRSLSIGRGRGARAGRGPPPSRTSISTASSEPPLARSWQLPRTKGSPRPCSRGAPPTSRARSRVEPRRVDRPLTGRRPRAIGRARTRPCAQAYRHRPKGLLLPPATCHLPPATCHLPPAPERRGGGQPLPCQALPGPKAVAHVTPPSACPGLRSLRMTAYT